MAWVKCLGWRRCLTDIRQGQKGFNGWCSKCKLFNSRRDKPTRTHAAVGRHSKGKGAAAELEVGRLLTPWWQQLEPAAQFIRTPGSGGWRHSSRFKARGDLMHDPDTCKLFPFTLEVKRREGWSDGLLFGRSESKKYLGDSSPIWPWWEQVCTSARDDGRRPMLWFRKNHSPWFVMFQSSVYDCLRLRGMTPPLVRFEAPRHTVVLTHAQTLWIPPRAFVAACTEVTETGLAASYGFEGRAR